MIRWFKETASFFGCLGKWYKPHDYQWGMGPDVPVTVEGGLLVQESYFGGPGEWWMYCTKCGHKIGDA